MSLARSLMDAYEVGQRVGDDVRSLRETGKNVAQIERESKQDMRTLQRDQFNYRKKNDERQRKDKQVENVFNHQILPVIESMRKNNATPEQYAVFNDKVKSEYGEVLAHIFGKNQYGEVNFDIGYSTMKKEHTGSSTIVLDKEGLKKYLSPEDSLWPIIIEKIDQNGGQATFKVEYTGDDSGYKMDLSSIGINAFSDWIKSIGVELTSENYEKYKQIYDSYYGIQKKVDQKTLDGGSDNDKPKKEKGVLERAKEFLHSINNPSVSNETKVTTKSAESENLPKFNTEDEALNANLPTGTKVIINGRRAVI